MRTLANWFPRVAGFSICFVYLVTSVWWWRNRFLRLYYPTNEWPTCHQFFPSCGDYILYPGVPQLILIAFGILSILGMILWVANWQRFAWWLTLGLLILKFFLFIGRFGMMGNYHLMHFLFTVVFLCASNGLQIYRWTFVVVYFLAGLLKLNLEWLSGAALVNPSWLSGPWLSFGLAYVVVLEIVVSWFLMSRNRLLRIAALVQFIIFHIFSWHVVGPFYPLTMLGLLFPLILAEFFPYEDWSLKDLFHFGGAIAALFLAWNLMNEMTLRDSALEGYFRGLRINMLDARSVCHPIAMLRSKDSTAILNFPASTKALRTHCDPAIFKSHLRKYCQNLQDGEALDWVLYARRTTSSHLLMVESERNFCASAH